MKNRQLAEELMADYQQRGEVPVVVRTISHAERPNERVKLEQVMRRTLKLETPGSDYATLVCEKMADGEPAEW